MMRVMELPFMIRYGQSFKKMKNSQSLFGESSDVQIAGGILHLRTGALWKKLAKEKEVVGYIYQDIH
jgi:hypothetical protein